MKTIKDYKEEFEKIYWETEIDGIKDYIFQELLPQVLSDILIEEDNRGMKWGSYGMKKFNSIEKIKQKAKEMGIKI